MFYFCNLKNQLPSICVKYFLYNHLVYFHVFGFFQGVKSFSQYHDSCSGRGQPDKTSEKEIMGVVGGFN